MSAVCTGLSYMGVWYMEACVPGWVQMEHQGGVCVDVSVCPGVMCVSVSVCVHACGGCGRRVLGRVSLLFRQSPGEDMKFKKKINFHSTCADCVKGRWGGWVRDEGAGVGGARPEAAPEAAGAA